MAEGFPRPSGYSGPGTLAPEAQGMAVFAPSGQPIQTPLWLRQRVRALIMQADSLGAECRALAELRLARRAEAEIAQRDVSTLARDIEQATRFQGWDQRAGEREWVERLRAAHKAALERLEMIRGEDRERLAELEQRSRIRDQAARALGAIIGALPDGGRIAGQARGRE